MAGTATDTAPPPVRNAITQHRYGGRPHRTTQGTAGWVPVTTWDSIRDGLPSPAEVPA